MSARMTLDEYVDVIAESEQPVTDALFLGFVQRHKLVAIRWAANRSEPSPLQRVCLELTEDVDGSAF